jgi:pyruvate-ferredoxin/flavodoxin oxidoreductase
MATRQSGFALLCSGNVQEAHDFALISQVASLKSRIPFLHFFDGFRTSHEVDKITLIDDATIKDMFDDNTIHAHRERALSPDHPFIRGTSQNPDVYFQGRESVNRFYNALPLILEETLARFARFSGRRYQLFEYIGAPDAQRLIILMGSGAEAVQESVEYWVAQGEKVGVIKVRLYRPFSKAHLIAALPSTVRAIAILDRTKEPGSQGEPLYLDITTALNEACTEEEAPFPMPLIVGGRHGLSSKEFTPGMIKAVFDNLSEPHPKNHFTIGIDDDLTHTSLEWEHDLSILSSETYEAIFFGLGSDGTVGANKNSIKIIGTHSDNFVQGYFVYDSKKSGSMTTSHLRFGPHPIRSTYLIRHADFVACHQSVFLEKFEILSYAKEGALFLLNTSFPHNEIWHRLPRSVQEEIRDKHIRFFTIDAYKIAKDNGLGARINTIMQVCFFALSEILPRKEALTAIKESIVHSYAKQGEITVQNNLNAVDQSIERLFKIPITHEIDSTLLLQNAIQGTNNPFITSIIAPLIEGHRDELPVSAIPSDGTWPSGTTRYEKRNIATEIPQWESHLCIECNKCVMVCPHAVIRSTIADESLLANAPDGFITLPAKGKNFTSTDRYTLQVSVEDCTGCALCVEICPASDKMDPNHKALTMVPQMPLRESGIVAWDYFTSLPPFERSKLDHAKVKESQFLEPLFEFSGACPGCGETPYLKLLSQLFGDRMMVANATGCSSIYGGNLPTTPWSKNAQGRGVAWSNSLFEDNAEFGLGMRLALDQHAQYAHDLIIRMESQLDPTLVEVILTADQHDEIEINKQRERIVLLKEHLKTLTTQEALHLLDVADYLVKKSLWIVGGDGWAYDIGYGGLDHVLASGKNVNILVLDTQVYSNTGGQQSKATPVGAVAKFAAGGKSKSAKDLALMALSYPDVYVARVAMGANDTQTLKAFIEAEAYDGVSIIIAYSHCIAHGYDLRYGMNQQKLAVESGLWPLFRYHPDRIKEGKNPMNLDYKGPQIPVEEYMMNETRFSSLAQSDTASSKRFLQSASEHAQEMFSHYSLLAKGDFS